MVRITTNAGDARDTGLIPGSGRSTEQEIIAHSVSVPGKSHRQKNPAGYSPWGHKGSDMTEHTNMNILLETAEGDKVDYFCYSE